MARERSHFIVGLMSGTSADGIDAVVARIAGRAPGLRAAVRSHVHQPFPPDLRRQIHKVALEGTVTEICELNVLLGERFARAALAAIRKARLKPAHISAIASHGQTISHQPEAQIPSTLQIGEPAVIAERCGVTTIADFRARDIAAGGQGAPLVAYADWALFTDPARPRIVQNIGGIANLTFLPPRARLDQVMAFDTGPGNMAIDWIVTALSNGKTLYDRDGGWAAQGQVSNELLGELMAHPFIGKAPPKTTGREQFGETFAKRILARARRMKLVKADVVATVTAFTAATIADAYGRFIFPLMRSGQLEQLQIILGGGGAKNPILVRMLADRVQAGELLTHEAFGIQSQAKEALAFAILGHETLHGRPGNVPAATGARGPVVLGKIVRP